MKGKGGSDLRETAKDDVGCMVVRGSFTSSKKWKYRLTEQALDDKRPLYGIKSIFIESSYVSPVTLPDPYLGVRSLGYNYLVQCYTMKISVH